MNKNILFTCVGAVVFLLTFNAYAGDLPDFAKPLPLESDLIGFTDPVTGMEFVFVKGGCYQMGEVAEISGIFEDIFNKIQVQKVCVDNFYIGKYEVTNKQFREFRPTHNSNGYGEEFFLNEDNQPVVYVSWEDATAFIKWLSEKTGQKYSLPTEAEWEYAARSGGKIEKWAGTNNETVLKEFAWYEDNSGGQTHPVGQKRPNGLGLYDMSGNAGEWVQGWYYKNPKDNPKEVSFGIPRIRGGSWASDQVDNSTDSGILRSSVPDLPSHLDGFRLLMTK